MTKNKQSLADGERKGFLNKAQYIVLLSLAFILLAAAAALVRAESGPAGTLISTRTTALTEGWTYLTPSGERREAPENFVVPVPEDGSILVFETTLPETEYNPHLLMRLSCEGFRVFVDEELVFEKFALESGRFLQEHLYLYRVIDLVGDVSGKTLRLEIWPYQGGYYLSDVSVGSSGQFVHTLAADNIVALIIIALLFVMGVFLLLFYLIARIGLKKFDYTVFLYLGCFVILSCCWLYTDSPISLVTAKNLLFIHMISFFLFALMPAPFILFLRQISKKSRGILDAASLLVFVNFIFQSVMFLTGWANLIQTLPATHVMLVVTIGLTMFVVWREKKRFGNQAMKGVQCAILVLVLFSVAAMICYYITPSNPIYAQLFVVGLFCFACVLIGDAMVYFVGEIRRAAEAAVYQKLAYTDGMTGLSNRAAFDRKMTKAAEDIPACQSLAIAVFDLNELKHINDNFGHASGDGAIVRAAERINDCFSDIGTCYRIGGDEFAVIFENVRKRDIDKAFQRFEEENRRVYDTESAVVPVSFGLEFRESAGTPADMEEIFRAADTKMYEMKRKLASENKAK